MVGLKFLWTIFQVLIYIILAGGILVAFVWVVNKTIQATADAIGTEATDFFEWALNKLKSKKKKEEVSK